MSLVATAKTVSTGMNSLRSALQRRSVDASMKKDTMKRTKPVRLIVHREYNKAFGVGICRRGGGG